MFVPPNFMITEQELLDHIVKFQELGFDFSWMDLLMSDYVYHHHEPNYEGGLSFLDRLKKKLGHRHPNWDIDAFKDWIRTHVENPTSAYQGIIAEMLERPEDLEYYGL
jgi:hypothetical protein